MSQPYNGFARFYDLFTQEDPNDVDFYASFVPAATSGARVQVLEIGVGTGRVIFELAEKMPEVSFVGLDSSLDMLAIAKSKLCVRSIKNVDLVHADVRNMSIEKRFDVILVTYQTFQFLLSVSDQISALRSICDHLRPGGKCVLHVFNPDPKQLVDNGEKKSFRYSAMDPITKQEVFWISRSKILRSEQLIDFAAIYRFISPDNQEGELVNPSQMRYFYRFELEHLAARCGLKLSKVFGDFDGSEYADSSPAIIVVLEKEVSYEGTSIL